MKKLITSILIFTLCLGCSDEKTEWQIERNAIIFFGCKLKNEKFTLSFKQTNKSLNYEYVNEIDSSKTIFIKKLKDSNSLLFGGEKFIKTDKEPFRNLMFQGLEFDFYDLENPVSDGTGPIIFNSKFGLLAIKNVFGPTIIIS
ncbi:hypothetical protein [Flavivirga jejuensis]|uniref:Lipoprotein n=1 Tax=Flavivirga jejuensis TaxID=870487 RepID=A0ABT8WQM0_9FLAO|nr:hypothetical protein [Flavivirga jejuensis]MDO5975434.1 hypothetical protein [Flavivirga jejuensis]